MHLSHYHAFPLINQPERNNLFCCADNDISDFPYFKNKFPWYNNLPFYVVPFVVDDRFEVCNQDKEFKCCITGTYHDIPRNKIDFGIYNSNGNSTLHPLRFELSNYNHDLINKRLTLFGYKDPLSKQKDYFKFNIVDFYNQHQYALVPGEGNGLIAIGSLEALNCGCKIFLTPWEAKGLFDDSEYVSYDGSLKDFIHKLEFLIRADEKNIIDNAKTISKFKKDELILRFKNTFSNND